MAENEVKKPARKRTVKPKIGKVSNCAALNVRKAPELNSAVLCIINAGTEVTVSKTGGNEEFYKVTLSNGVEGYCMKRYIEL